MAVPPYDLAMVLPNEPVTLSPEEIRVLSHKLAEMRHNVNNCLALVTAAAEVVARKPDMAERLMANLIEQPHKIVDQIQAFSQEFEERLKIQRET